MEPKDIEQLLLQTLRQTNEAREPDNQLAVAPDAAIFGPDSPLDSLGLVALLMDVEDALLEVGHDVLLSDERAMSSTRSPFRDVPSLVQHIERLLGTAE